jgi:hypothetical protein
MGGPQVAVHEEMEREEIKGGSQRMRERQSSKRFFLSFFQIFEIFVVLLLESGAGFGRSGGGEICWRGSDEKEHSTHQRRRDWPPLEASDDDDSTGLWSSISHGQLRRKE